MTDQRLTIRLSEEDDQALQVLQNHMRPLSFVSRVDLIRYSIQKAAAAIIATGAIG